MFNVINLVLLFAEYNNQEVALSKLPFAFHEASFRKPDLLKQSKLII